MSSPTVPQRKISTDQSPPHLRLSFWEAHNASELIGLQCSSHSNGGLAAREHNFDLGCMRLADIAGNEHVIERTPTLLRRFPKDSIFMALVTEGDAFFYQRGHCLTARPGDVLIYTTSQPYLCGFGRSARQFLADMPAQFLQEIDDQWCLNARPIKIGGALQGEQTLSKELDRAFRGFAATPLSNCAPVVADRIRALCRAMLAPHSKVCAGESAQVRRLQAEAFISERLGEHSLNANVVAQYLCISPRHLNRLFEVHSCTANQWIWKERLAAAKRMLTEPTQRFLSVGDVGFRCGFTTAAHFSRAFKSSNGLTPSQYRHFFSAMTEA